MGIDLFAYNKQVYIATQILTKKGKTAILPLTDTEKSFIGFNLCEEHLDKTTACRLSFSKYNRKTQANNPLKAAEGYVRDGCPVDRLVFKSG